MAAGGRARPPGRFRPRRRLGPADLVRAAGTLFNVVTGFLAGYVADDPGLLPCFVTAVQALNDSISRRIREATLAHTGSLLERVDQAHVDERRRIARDLHDRLGEGMSVALRQLKLHEIASSHDPRTQARRAAMAKSSLAEADTQAPAGDFGPPPDPVTSLEKAITHYVNQLADHVNVRLRVSGDRTGPLRSSLTRPT